MAGRSHERLASVKQEICKMNPACKVVFCGCDPSLCRAQLR